MANTLPQIRPLPGSVVEGPVLKRPRLDTDVIPTRVEVEAPAKEDTPRDGDEVMQEVVEEAKLNSAGGKKGTKSKKTKKKKDPPLPDPCSAADVLYREIRELLGEETVDRVTDSGNAFKAPYTVGEEVVVKIERIGSGGSGIAVAPEEKGPWAIVVPCALPREMVRVRIGRYERMHSCASVVEVVSPNTELRDDSRVRCKYFGTCGGCQYQMLSGETQLELKRDAIVRAYKTYSGAPLPFTICTLVLTCNAGGLPESAVPTVESTIESPLVYAYRTKITPHFERPPKYAKKQDVAGGSQPPWLKIGFNVANSNSTMDIEECPIATSVLNEKYKSDRTEIIQNIFSYKKGVSLMYRDSLDPTFDAKKMMLPPVDKLSEAFTKHACVTDQKGVSRELVGDKLFQYTAGGFFQNNNAVLPLLVDHVRGLIDSEEGRDHPTHLVDTYCGAGLFAISLSDKFTKVAGIELSQSSIASAKENATLNGIPEEKISFLSGEAQNIFATVRDFPPERTVVVIDPPRKGCDELFLKQLLDFRCNTVVYVSCNVHSQARDIGEIVRRTEGDGEGRRYRMESLRGFDLFPQTAHVESVALLRLY
ncbi:hypothetical protein NLJ89_g5697 [Agrocybe chaxingu]|uniref:TRAM domain-containing protein n=1 Tax=Agrocybe chaxingu TaxID=84603 RepID=A0A9W8JY03_9AGAR|nr:hypothetical protein NLJ89_g5697 [Agrocybe chaxingu]